MIKKIISSHPIICFFLALILWLSILIINPVQRLSYTSGLQPSQHMNKQSIMVATWNIYNQNSVFGGDNNARINQEFAQTSLGNSDFIVLQEVVDVENMRKIAEQHGFNLYGDDNAILSKKTILASGTTRVNKSRTAFWADIQITPETTLRLYSIHLSYKKVGYSPYIEELRGKEIAMLLKHANQFNGPVIIAGDFNTISLFNFDFENAPVFSNLQQANYQANRDLGECNTHIPMGEQDWIFTRGMQSTRFMCGNYANSDHRWVQAELKFNALTN